MAEQLDRTTQLVWELNKRIYGTHPISNNIVNILNAFLEARTGEPGQIKKLVDTCEIAGKNIRSFAERSEPEVGEEHEPGNPQIHGWEKTTDFRGDIRFAHPKKPLSIIITKIDLGDGRFSYSSGLYDTFYHRREEAFPDRKTQKEAIDHAVKWMEAHPEIVGWEKLKETDVYFEYVNTADRNITLTADLTKMGWEIYLFNSQTNKIVRLLTATEARKRGFVKGNIVNFMSYYMKNNPTVTL